MPGTVRPPSAPAFSLGPNRSRTGGSLSGEAHAITNFAGTSSPNINPDLIKVCPSCGVRYPGEFKVCPRDAVELTEVNEGAEEDELVGKTLAQTYTIVRVIGEGGMGRVYEARHTRLASKRFAIKLLHPEYTRQTEVLTRFQREAEAAAAIRSPYVLDVYDVDRTADGRPFLVGEFLEGKEFANHLDQVGKMEVGAAVRIVRQICKALSAAHEKGVVHRDMKPENVFLTGNPKWPTAKVIDFGISKLADTGGTNLTKTGMIMGTPSYMAPEQARGERVDHRADIYAVGAILYCALTGQRPFDRSDPTATLTAVLTEDPPRPRSLEPSIPEPLEMIIQRAMAKQPADRHATMAELDTELAPYEATESDEALAVVPTSRMTTADRHRDSIDRQVRIVAMARPMILLLGALGLFWAAGNLMLAITAIVRISRGGPRGNLAGAEAVFLVVGFAFTLLTPLILAWRHLKRVVWVNTVKAVDLADHLRRPVLIGLSTYGFASLLVRVIETVFLRHAGSIAWPWWDLILLVVGAAAVGGAVALDHLESAKKP